jgi:hypothetical protein
VRRGALALALLLGGCKVSCSQQPAPPTAAGAPARVSWRPGALTLRVGQDHGAHPVVRDVRGVLLPGAEVRVRVEGPAVSWSDGVLRAEAEGAALVYAEAGGFTAALPVSVGPASALERARAAVQPGLRRGPALEATRPGAAAAEGPVSGADLARCGAAAEGAWVLLGDPPELAVARGAGRRWLEVRLGADPEVAADRAQAALLRLRAARLEVEALLVTGADGAALGAAVHLLGAVLEGGARVPGVAVVVPDASELQAVLRSPGAARYLTAVQGPPGLAADAATLGLTWSPPTRNLDCGGAP